MLILLILAFGLGCIFGALLADLARWHRQRSAARDLVRALESGRLYYGPSSPAASSEQRSNTPE